MTGNAASDFRIKLLVVHPDGRRQKFLVTFPERKSLKIDQRYIGLPLTLRVDFPPGAIVCRPGTGHTLSVANKPVKDHTLAVNDVIGLDQYSIEFLELPEPLPIEEATRFVSISDLNEQVAEATIVVSSPVDAMERTPAPATPHRLPPQQHRPAPQQNYTPPPAYTPPPEAPRRPDPEDSTAIIRRLQVPGTAPNGNPYATLQPSIPQRLENTNTATGFTRTDTSIPVDPSAAPPPSQPVQFNKRHIAIAGSALLALSVYLFIGKHMAPSSHESEPTEVTEEMSEDGSSPEAAMNPTGEMKQVQLEEPAQPKPASEPSSSASVPVVPAPQTVAVPAAVPMGGGKNEPGESPLDDKGGFDTMAVDQFFDAVDAGDEARIKDLLEKRVVDVNLSRRRGFAALHLSAARGDLATVKFLMKMKADPNVLDGSGATPLMWSVFRRHEDVVRFLAPKTDLKIERQGGETAFDLAKRTNMKKLLTILNPDPKKAGGKKRVPTALPEKKKR